MERRFYDAESLGRALTEIERHFGMSSKEFYERHRHGDDLEVPNFERHVWASLCEDVDRLCDSGAVIDRVGRTFAHA